MYSEGNTSDICVLLVEDDDDDYVLVQDLFEEIGRRYKLERVSSYDEAVRVEDPFKYDVCLLDYRLGAHDGLELLRDLRRLGFRCPMILLTGQDDDTIDRMAMQAGAADYII